MNNSASEMKPLFDQHQSSDCLRLEAFAAERNSASQKKYTLQQQRILIGVQERNITKRLNSEKNTRTT
jgi:hypothetical protein